MPGSGSRSWSDRAPAVRRTRSRRSPTSSGPGVAKALLGKDVLSDELPFVTGSIGILGTRPTYEMMRDCDALLIVGSNMPYSQFLPEFGKARAVQIDLDGTMIGMRYPIEVNLVGDAAATLRALLPQLSGPTDRAWREKIEENVVAWWGTMERQAMLDGAAGQPHADRLGALGAAARRTRSSRPTPAPSRTGTRGS